MQTIVQESVTDQPSSTSLFEFLTASGLDYVWIGAAREVLRVSPGAPALLGLTDVPSPAAPADPQLVALLNTKAQPVRLDDGSTLCLLRGEPPASPDVQEVQRHNRILRDTLDAIDGTVVVYDRDRRYVFGNRAYHDMFPHLPSEAELAGQLYEEILARSITAGTVLDPEAYTDRDSFIARRVQEMAQEEVAPREAFSRIKQRWHMIRVSHTPDGNRVALRVDINAQKQLQAELATAHHAAEAASRAKSQFLANVSHELRTPLNAVINFAQLIVEELHGPIGNPKYREYAETIRTSGQYLLALFNDLLDLARAETGRLTLTRQPVNLRAQISSVCRMMAPEAETAQVTLVSDLPAELSPVLGDGTRLRQVLVNLISNAIKFSEPGGTIRVAAKPTDGGVRITITDNGCGIAPGDLERVLLPFEQVVDPSRRLNPGAGLGLPLAKHLVDLHGGTLTLDSTPHHGTTVTVDLPGAPPRIADRAGDAQEKSGPATEVAGPEEGPG